MATFRTFFHGSMSGFEITCLKSFLDHGHRVIVFTYNALDVPDMFEKADAADVLPQDRVFFYKCGPGQGSIGGFANLFRYMLLQRYGDWWIDTDVLCLSEPWPDSGGRAVAGWEDDERIAIGVLALPPNIAEACVALAAASGENLLWGETGPHLMTKIFRDHNLAETALPPTAFYPVHWRDWTDPFDPEELHATEAACASSMTVHLWHELIRRSGVDKRWLPPGDTFFGRAVLKHGTAEHFVPVAEEDYRRQMAVVIGRRQIAGAAK